jgi:hypothetical protein
MVRSVKRDRGSDYYRVYRVARVNRCSDPYIRIHLIRIWIQHFGLNTDPDPIWIRIQSGSRVLNFL